MKELALVIWACARIKMPNCDLSYNLYLRSRNLIKNCTENNYLFDWSYQGSSKAKIQNVNDDKTENE